jgi:hypothetical protein
MATRDRKLLQFDVKGGSRHDEEAEEEDLDEEPDHNDLFSEFHAVEGAATLDSTTCVLEEG